MVDTFSDPAVTAAVIVSAPEEMPVSETLELAERLRTETDVFLAGVIVNKVLPELFGRLEEETFHALREPAALDALAAALDTQAAQVTPVLDAAQLAVTLRRTRAGHLTRLREGLSRDVPFLYVPYLFKGDHGVRSTRALAEALAAELGY
jgi:anion-transporting  ArsA/GET3 family ATPase